MKKAIIVFGTRPEAIKMAPVIREIQKSKKIDVKIVSTGQHKEMLNQVLDIFNIKPDYDLKLMTSNQSLPKIFSNIVKDLSNIYEQEKPDLVIVHGYTITTLAASLSAYFQQIHIAHVEAGLRTRNLYSPWPEEGNRKLTGSICKYHFAPTETAKQNLL